ncbi:LysR family transcriptional regulator [Sphingobium sp.]|uniref:LysR family transcriptional regulator n=1 Tax=Sphingobium sp. TaxID=1912891 RepID=UPI0028BEF4DB|nr:LysR family transcriptional regulator [Sphingobium sp.]
MARFEHLDLNLLRVFDIIYSERSLTRAARVLNISQPAVSNALHRLRESLGDPLFVRERRGMMPTSFADGIAPTVHKALAAIKNELTAHEGFSPATTERGFRLSMNDPAEALFLHRLIVNCLAQAPRVDLQCNFISRHDIANEMARGTLDIAIEVPIAPDERVRHADLLTESFACLVRPGHPLIQTGLSMEQYLALDHVHVSARRYGLGHIDRILSERGMVRPIKARMRSPAIAADIIHNSDLTMTMPERFARYYGLATLPLPFAVPSLDWRLYWPARHHADAGNRWLREQILDIVRRA